MISLGLLVFFSYLYSINNSQYMPKNTLFTRLHFVSKNDSFYFFLHFIFQDASPLHFKTILFGLFSAQSINVQKTQKRPPQL